MIENTIDNYILFFAEKRRCYGRLWRKAIKTYITSTDNITRLFYAKQAKWFKEEWKKLDKIIFRLKICKGLQNDIAKCVDINSICKEIIEKYGGENNDF